MTSGSVTADHAVSSRSEELRRQAMHVSCRRRSLGEGTRDRALQGQGEREPETLRPVIAGVERHPFPGDRVQGLEPLRGGHGLPGGGTAGHQRHPPVGLAQNLGRGADGQSPGPVPPGTRTSSAEPKAGRRPRERHARAATHPSDPITAGSEVPGPKVPSGVCPSSGPRSSPCPAGPGRRTRNGCGQLTLSGGSL